MAKLRIRLRITDETVEYYGTLQGTIHNLNIGSSPSFFQLRELATKSLVKCVFKPDRYESVIDLLRDRNAVVLVSGLVRASREHRSIESLSVERLDHAEQFTHNDLEQFFGCAPDLTGDMTTDEYMDSIRRGALPDS